MCQLKLCLFSMSVETFHEVFMKTLKFSRDNLLKITEIESRLGRWRVKDFHKPLVSFQKTLKLHADVHFSPDRRDLIIGNKYFFYCFPRLSMALTITV